MENCASNLTRFGSSPVRFSTEEGVQSHSWRDVFLMKFAPVAGWLATLEVAAMTSRLDTLLMQFSATGRGPPLSPLEVEGYK